MSNNNQKMKRKDSNRKRNLSEVSDVDHVEGDMSLPVSDLGDSSCNGAPPYGSQKYWEERYSRHLRFHLNDIEDLPQISNQGSKNNSINNRTEHQCGEKEKVTSENDVDELSSGFHPYHSWYFKYTELRPLILPLLLGGRDDFNEIMDRTQPDSSSDADDERENVESNNETKQYAEICGRISRNTGDSASPNDESHSNADIEENESFDNTDEITRSDRAHKSEGSGSSRYSEIEEFSTNDESNDDRTRENGLAKDGPIRILEIGCGDMPLGLDLANEFRNLQLDTGAPSSSIISEIICVDYSKVVIDAMNKLYNKKNVACDVDSASQGVVLKFEVADARFLPYDNGSFEFILEKGTLDAMLSDHDCGLSNCIQTIAECARLLTPNMSKKDPNLDDESKSEIKATSSNGCLLLVSHLNANSEKGMRWLNDVVLAGLLQYSKVDELIEWEIEVHGNSGVDESDPRTKDKADSLGPAVYVIHKRRKEPNPTVQSNEQSKVGDLSHNIPIIFFAY